MRDAPPNPRPAKFHGNNPRPAKFPAYISPPWTIYARENCEYTFVGLRQVLFKFKAPASVSSASGSITDHYFYRCR